MHPRLYSPHQFLRIFVIVNITTYITVSAIMGGKKAENTKKVAGNAKVRLSKHPRPWILYEFIVMRRIMTESRSRRTETSSSRGPVRRCRGPEVAGRFEGLVEEVGANAPAFLDLCPPTSRLQRALYKPNTPLQRSRRHQGRRSPPQESRTRRPPR